MSYICQVCAAMQAARPGRWGEGRKRCFLEKKQPSAGSGKKLWGCPRSELDLGWRNARKWLSFNGKTAGSAGRIFRSRRDGQDGADLACVNRKTAAFFYHRLRQVIARELEYSSPVAGEIEIDESYFGGHRKGKRGRGAGGKVAVFGILKRGGKVYTVLAPNLQRATLMPIIRDKVIPDSVVYTDSYNVYDSLDVSEFHHHRIDHSTAFARDGHNHINGIENFWNQAKRTLSRYNGIPKAHFALFLKEAEFRFNCGSPKEQLRLLKRWVRKP